MSYSVLTNPTVGGMGFLTHFNLQVLAGTGNVLSGTRVKPLQRTWMSEPQPRTLHGMGLLLAGQCPSPNALGTRFSPDLYLSLAQVPFSNSEHKLARAEGSETKAGIFPLLHTHLSHCASCQNDFIQIRFLCQGTSDLDFLNVRSQHTFRTTLYVLYVLCLPEAYSKQLSLTFTPSANTFLNP